MEDVSSVNVETGANEAGNGNAASADRNSTDDVYIRFMSSVFGRGTYKIGYNDQEFIVFKQQK